MIHVILFGALIYMLHVWPFKEVVYFYEQSGKTKDVTVNWNIVVTAALWLGVLISGSFYYELKREQKEHRQGLIDHFSE